MHKCLKFIVGNFAWRGGLDLAQHGLELIVRQMFSFAAETFLQVGLCDKARVVNVEVMESEEHVVIGDSLAPVNSHSKEFRVVDLAIMVEINALKHLIDFCC